MINCLNPRYEGDSLETFKGIKILGIPVFQRQGSTNNIQIAIMHIAIPSIRMKPSIVFRNYNYGCNSAIYSQTDSSHRVNTIFTPEEVKKTENRRGGIRTHVATDA